MISLFYFIVAIMFVISLVIQGWLKSTFARWSGVRNSLDAPGAVVAKEVLARNGLWNVRLGVTSGRLSDHYDPRRKSISLSQRIYREPSIASAAIAAHECGHAIQDKERYGPMQLRNRMVPVATLGAQYGPWAVIGGWMSGSQMLVQVGCILYVGALLIQLFNLPVEFDASRRARNELENLGMTSDLDRRGAKKVLRGAAMTYVAGSATAMFHLVFILFVFGRGLFVKPVPTP